MNKVLATIAAAATAVVLLAVLVLAAAVDGAISCASNAITGLLSPIIKVQEQLDNWLLINKIGVELGIPKEKRVVALAVAYQESDAKNVEFGDRDSLGLFQQRPSQGWGTREQILDPVYSTTKFYQTMLGIKGYESMNPLPLALAVQRPSYAAYTSPDHNFNSWLDDATSFVNQVESGIIPKLNPNNEGVPTAEETQQANDKASLCRIAVEGFAGGLQDAVGKLVPSFNSSDTPGKLGMPLENPVVSSEYGMRFHPIDRVWRLHDGIDFAAPCGTPLYASAAGVIRMAEFRSGPGYYTQIDHGGGVDSGYAHQTGFAPGIRTGATVERGQLIGYVGTTGKSTGCHLHYRVFFGGSGLDDTVNPRPFLGLPPVG